MLLLGAFGAAQSQAASADWITESNRDAKLLTDITAKYNPEDAAATGIEGHDADVIDLRPRVAEREEADLASAAEKLKVLRGAATDVRVQQDLDILMAAADNTRHTLALTRQAMVPFFDLPQTLFSGFQTLIHDGVAKERQAQALLRLRRYTGTVRGYEPIAVLAREHIAEGLTNPALITPWTVEIQESLDNQSHYIDGIRDLFKKSGLKGWQPDFNKLSAQLNEYGRWVKSDVLPRARKTSRLPEALYADNLKSFGVDADPRELMQQALAAFTQTREEMATLAGIIAAQHGFQSTAYQDVIRELKKQKIPNEKLTEVYHERLAKIERIIGDHHLATLPKRDAVIVLATEAESAATPAPHVDLPRLIGNTGQPATFVIPVSNPSAKSADDYDDFSYDAVTWTMVAHEARPGHELQFARMLEQGVSTARAVFAFNSANVEGWALYSEAFMKQYFPLEGQLAVLQLRLMRAARAFLDPMVNLGLIEPDVAKRVLLEDVGVSGPLAKEEIDRYSFISPGQATAYFYGYQQLEATRAKAQIALGDRFDVLSYHDFILVQGLLPLRLLDKAVMEEYVPSRRQ
jgi:uncharacterized protein (DUF885 family)